MNNTLKRFYPLLSKYVPSCLRQHTVASTLGTEGGQNYNQKAMESC